MQHAIRDINLPSSEMPDLTPHFKQKKPPAGNSRDGFSGRRIY